MFGRTLIQTNPVEPVPEDAKSKDASGQVGVGGRLVLTRSGPAQETEDRAILPQGIRHRFLLLVRGVGVSPATRGGSGAFSNCSGESSVSAANLLLFWPLQRRQGHYACGVPP
jgi:hypothetical protein